MLCTCVSSFPSAAPQTAALALGDGSFSPPRSSFSSVFNPSWRQVASSDHPGNVFILLVNIGGTVRVGVCFFPFFKDFLFSLALLFILPLYFSFPFLKCF